MKRLAIILTVIAAFYQISSAQEVGIRLGNAYTGYVSLDLVWEFDAGKVQTESSSKSLIDLKQILRPKRIHSDMTFLNHVFSADALCDFIYAPVLSDNLYCYAGPGVMVYIGNGFQFWLAGEAGLEYRFAKVPLALGADWCPAATLNDGLTMNFFRLGVNLRYVF